MRQNQTNVYYINELQLNPPERIPVLCFLQSSREQFYSGMKIDVLSLIIRLFPSKWVSQWSI